MTKESQKETKQKFQWTPKYKFLLIVAVVIIALCAWKVYDMGGFEDLDNVMNPNTAPEIVYMYPGAPVYSSQLTAVDPVVVITELRAGVIDRDGDTLMVSFWIKHGTAPWSGVALFEGNNGTYMYKLPRSYLIPELVSGNYTWRVDVFDGRVTTSKTCPMYVV